MSVRAIAIVVTAVAAIGAATLGAAAAAEPIAAHVRTAAFGAPLPLDPAADVPSTDQLLGLLNGLQDPNVPFASKSDLVDGGISPVEARLADVRMKEAVARGEVPLTLKVANIAAAGANTATADVTMSGPKLSPTTRNVTFVDHGGWKLTHASAIALLQESGASN
jgi:hypothetical protein